MARPTATHDSLTRRRLLGGLTAAATLASVGVAPRAALAEAGAHGPGATYLLRIKRPLIAAGKTQSRQAFLRAVNRYADMPAIASYSLGDYSDKLPSNLRRRYQRGVAEYMSRFFELASRTYVVKDADILSEEPYEDDGVMVQTRVHLENGASYSVGFLLRRRGRSYRIRDAKVMGFWLGYFQKIQFTRFISRNGGDVEALVRALRA